jgi:hypothetical protein
LALFLALRSGVMLSALLEMKSNGALVFPLNGHSN